MQVNYSDSSSHATLSFDIDQKRTGTQTGPFSSPDYARSFGVVRFEVNADTTYDLSGWYTALDESSPGHVELRANIFDFSTDEDDPFNNHQKSRNTANESFTLGATDGDYDNLLVGSLSGNLIGGRVYQLNYWFITQSSPDVDAGVSAEGDLILKIGESNAVPEPSTIAIWSILGCVGLAIAHRRRRFRDSA